MSQEVGRNLGDLKNRIIQGDPEAFKEWMNIHIRPIELFTVQYGISQEEAGDVAETIFKNLYGKLGLLTEEDLEEVSLFKTAEQQLKGKQLDAQQVGLFSFEEDNELHRKITNLPQEIRIPLILAKFHSRSVAEIAKILDEPDQQVEDAIKKTIHLLDEPNVEKKLEFLNLSFERLSPSYIESDIFKRAEEISQLKEPVTKVNKRKPIALWSAGAVILIVILFVSVFRSDAYQQSSSERFLEKLSASFQQELDDRFELIGLSEPEEADKGYTTVYQGLRSEVSPVSYGYGTKNEFNRFIREMEREISTGGKINKKEAKRKYDELVFDLRLPSEMVEQLQKEPLTGDREQSLIFLDELQSKNEFLANAYMEIVGENMEMIFESDLISDGMVDVDELLARKASFPIEWQNAIDGMDTQYFSLTSIKELAPLYSKYGTPELEEILRGNLHPHMQVYISLLLSTFEVVYTGTFDDHLETLLALEKELPNTKESDQLSHHFNSYYIVLFITAAGLNSERGIYNSSGVVRQEIKDRWKRLAANGEESPSGQVIREMIDEMEASNWTTSPSLEELMNYGVWVNLESKMEEARAGKSAN